MSRVFFFSFFTLRFEENNRNGTCIVYQSQLGLKLSLLLRKVACFYVYSLRRNEFSKQVCDVSCSTLPLPAALSAQIILSTVPPPEDFPTATAHLTWSCGVCFSLKQEEALKAEEETVRRAQVTAPLEFYQGRTSNSTHLLQLGKNRFGATVHTKKKDINWFLLEHGPHFVGSAWGRSTCGQRRLCPPWKAILSQK